jgi:anti-anti-sigma factor
MQISSSDIGGVTVLRLSGRLDTSTAPEAQAEITALLKGETDKLLVNLEGVDYVSSAGLRVLLMAAKGIRKKNGTIVLCALSENVSNVFEMSGFSSIFEIRANEEEALAAF